MLLELRFLGGLAIQQNGMPLTALKSQKGQALLCYLALTGKAHSRPVLAGLLWPEMGDEKALMNLRHVLKQLKRHLAPHLAISRQSIGFNQDVPYWLDVAEFEAGVAANSDSGRLQAAVSHYHGDFLDGFYLSDVAYFDGWVLAQRARLRELALAALQRLVTHFTAEAEYETAIGYARQQLAIEPWREEGHRELMRLLALSGERSAALRQYETCRRILAEEVAVEPAAETEALYQAIRAEQGSRGAEGQGSRGGAQARTPPPHNLPLQLSSFIGREREMAEVGRLLASSRLLTLTGPGGCGKTRLALQAAGGVLDTFADGVWFVELASLFDAALVPQAVASALDVREVEDRPLLVRLQSYLRTRQLLLLLDNCEHLVEAAAQLAETLLRHCPQLQILATSREALNITGEAAWLVPSLSLPEPGSQAPPDSLRQADAIRLFAERATAILPDFTLTAENAAVVEQVCRRLDGMPLAIELAAAWVRMLRVEQIAARLDDRFHLLADVSRNAVPRHQTLQALIDWSYDLLAPAEQRLLCWLSVFAGGFTLEAAEAVCADKEIAGVDHNLQPSSFSPHPSNVLELLAQLVHRSLVVSRREPGQEARYHLLETIRQYAWAKLAEGCETGLAQSRHLNFFLQLAEAAEPQLSSGEQLVWLDRLEAEHDNLQATLAWSLEKEDGDVESGLRLATALVGFWIMRSHLLEARRWLDAALEKRNSAALPVRARLLLQAGWLWVELDSVPTALLQESLALYGQLDDKKGMAWSLHWLSWCAVQSTWDLVAASSLVEQSLGLAGEINDKPLLTWLYYDLAWIAMHKKGDYSQATELCTTGLTLAEEAGDQRMKLHLLYLLGRSARRQRHYARAMAFFHEALVVSRELKNGLEEARVLNGLGEVARVQRVYEQATLFYRESLALHREVDNKSGIAASLHKLGLVALGQGDRLQARSLFRESMALDQEVKREAIILWNVWGLARVSVAEGHTRRAAQLLATAGLRMEIERLDPLEKDDYKRDVALARAELGEEAFAAAWAEGQAMSLEEAIAYALEEG